MSLIIDSISTRQDRLELPFSQRYVMLQNNPTLLVTVSSLVYYSSFGDFRWCNGPCQLLNKLDSSTKVDQDFMNTVAIASNLQIGEFVNFNLLSNTFLSLLDELKETWHCLINRWSILRRHGFCSYLCTWSKWVLLLLVLLGHKHCLFHCRWCLNQLLFGHTVDEVRQPRDLFQAEKSYQHQVELFLGRYKVLQSEAQCEWALLHLAQAEDVLNGLFVVLSHVWSESNDCWQHWSGNVLSSLVTLPVLLFYKFLEQMHTRCLLAKGESGVWEHQDCHTSRQWWRCTHQGHLELWDDPYPKAENRWLETETPWHTWQGLWWTWTDRHSLEHPTEMLSEVSPKAIHFRKVWFSIAQPDITMNCFQSFISLPGGSSWLSGG